MAKTLQGCKVAMLAMDARIRAACTRALEANGGAAVVLRSGLFRMEGA